MSATSHPAFARFMPFVFVFLWSTGFVGAKFGLPYADPFVFLFVRFVIVLVLMVPVVILMGAKWPKTWREAVHIGTTGALVHGLYLGGVFWAIDTGLPAGLAALIVGLQPVVTASVVGAILGERVSLRQWGGLVLGLVGVIALIKEPLTVEWSMDFILAMAWLVLVLSIGAIMLLMVLIKQGEATRVASMFYLVPPTAAMFAWLLFDEQLGLLGFVGFGVAALGVALVMIKR